MSKIVSTRPIGVRIVAGMTLVLGTAPGASATSWYVATTGDDVANTGVSVTSPFATIGYGVGKLQAGDTLYVRGGVYNEVVNVYPPKNGPVLSATTPIRILQYQNEKPVIDGQGQLPAGTTSHPLLGLRGDYIQVSGFEVRNSSAASGAMGVSLIGNYDTVTRLNVHNNAGVGILIQGQFGTVQYSTADYNAAAGIFAQGDNGLVQYNVAYQNAYTNCRAAGCPASPYPNGGWATGISAARSYSNASGISNKIVLLGNVVYNNWGEGLSAFETNGALLQGNTVYDNWAANTYISDATNVLVQNNLIYDSSNPAIPQFKSLCMSMADEKPNVPRSTNNIVVNNMCFNGGLNAFNWTQVPGSGLRNATIADNTIVNGTISFGQINQGDVIKNNIVQNHGLLAVVPSASGLAFVSNLWSSAPVANARGPNDVIANPGLALAGPTGPGQLTPAFFAPTSMSAARNVGAVVSGVSYDASGAPRGARATDIGALVFVAK